jgi:galactose mutarotase-like enzyme
MHSISNGIITIQVANKGAELQSIYHHANQQEYMWSADPAFWAKKSPVLFPVVGGLNKKHLQLQRERLPVKPSRLCTRHGF